MGKQIDMLETIYEVDENMIPDDDDDTPKCINQSSRIPHYICWCIITGCFLVIILITTISLNPSLLIDKPINKMNSINLDEKLKLSTEIIKHLDIFLPLINKQLYLQPNTIKFLTSTISNSSLENQNGILWIYSHLKYPSSCMDDNHCKENLHLKLKISFTKLANFLTTIELNSYHGRQIHLDWCNLIETENSTTAILVSLASINQNAIESSTIVDPVMCENIDLLSKTIENIIYHDQQSLTQNIDYNNDNDKNEEETNITCNNLTDCSSYNDNHHHHLSNEKAQCRNDIGTQLILLWNFFSTY